LTADTVGPGHGWVSGVVEGKGRVTGALAQLRELLATPWIAIVLGLALGGCLLAPLFGIRRLLKAKHADIALFVVMGTVFGGLILGLAVLMGYWFISRAGFIYFGSATVAGFVISLGILSVRAARELLTDDDSEG
jgi:hypothetical protein